MRCSECDADNTAGQKFCGSCGKPLKLRCPSCGAENPPGFRFCGECGAALGASVVAASAKKRVEPQIRVADAAAENLDGERKTVTALFADIKGSTELEQDLDPEEARAIVDPALRLMIDAVHRYDGYIVQSTGDGIFALFGAPVAHEDHPQRALYSALRMQDEVRGYADKLRADGRAPIQIRVGANTGEVVVRSITTGEGHSEYTPIGHTTNLASRMQTLANPGSTVIAESTRKLVEGYFALKPLGATKIKGVTEPVNVYEVTGLGPLRTRLQRSAGRGLTRFVGREREMDAMRAAAEQARRGHGQIVAAMAEAGTGKSRLFFEFKAKQQAGWMVLETFSVSHGKASAYLPIIELLHGYFRITSDDDARTRREKVAGKVAILDRALEDTLPYLFGLLGIIEGDDPLAQMDGQVKRRRTLDAIKRILLRESMNQPLMVIFEDLHWIDDETQAFLNLLADSIGTANILLLVNYRPEYSHQWGSKTYYTQLRLDPLGKESAEEMLSSLLASPAPAALTAGASRERPVGDIDVAERVRARDIEALKWLIIEKTEGNPFFMEETVQVLLDEGALVRNGVVKLTKTIAELKIPPTVQAILAARIDRLPQDAKDLLQTLAVIGREFPLSLIRSVVSIPDDETRRLLDDLQLGEFIYEQPAIGDSEYVFKHALTQEVSYNSVLMERRRQLHGRIGAALERLYASSIDDHLDELAHHYSASSSAMKALEYYERAGRQAAQRSAYTEAVRDLSAAVELLKTLPESPKRDQRELGLQTSLGPLLMISKGWAAAETGRVYLRAHELAQTRGSTAQHFSSILGLLGIDFVGGRLRAAQEWKAQILNFTREHPEPAFMLEAEHQQWSTAFTLGNLVEAQGYVKQGLALCQQVDRSRVEPTAHDPAVCGLSWGALAWWLRGFPDSARRDMDKALSVAHEVGHLPTVAYALKHKAQLHQMMRELDAALKLADAAIAISEKEGFPYYLTSAQIIRGWALAGFGQAQEGVRQMRDGLAALTATGVGLWLTNSLATLAEACGRAGRISEGLDSLAEALDLVERDDERWWEAEIVRLRGELLLRQSDSNSAEARSCFERAIQIARKQDAKSLELRATASLAQLLAKEGKRAEARAMLADIYNWFTEGFDTADLKDAKALLDELSA